MGMTIRIAPMAPPQPGLDALSDAALAEGFGFLRRLMQDWASGANRFDQPGEQLIGAFAGTHLLGVCGLNRDPYLRSQGVGRLRHLYVAPGHRRHGIATALVRPLLGTGDFHQLRLRTDTAEAAAFYLRLGFHPVADATASHAISLRPAGQRAI
jgi:GNAT superfamily N-acetyltransferase